MIRGINTMECKKEQNKVMCTCTAACGKKGLCCECVEYHRSSGQIPGCFFPKNAEKTYDRSISYFAKVVRDKE